MDKVKSHDGYADELPAGTPLLHGQYKVSGYLNSGGFGITYLATDSLDRTVVIKECFPDAFCRRSNLIVQARSRSHSAELKAVVGLFLKEARSLSKLTHPNIVGVHQVFEDNETAYMALDFVEGHDLLQLIEKPAMALTPDQIVTLLEKLLDAIGFVHRAGILHRDISPDNIIVKNDLNPVLIDFGAAREKATQATQALSALRVVKDGYSPQEFYLAGSDQGPSSDLYSLAATFYHLITGQLPPDSQVRLSAFVAKEPDPYIPLATMTDAYDDAFCRALDQAMSILPKDRVQTAEAWKTMIAGAPPVAEFVAPAKPKSRRVTRARSKVAPKTKPRPKATAGPNRLAAVMVIGALGILLSSALFYRTGPDATGTQVAVATPQTVAPIPAPAAIEDVVAAPAPDAVPAAAAPLPPAELRTTTEEVKAAQIPLPAPEPSPAPEQTVFADGRVTVTWFLDLPFTVADDATIASVTKDAPSWLTVGMTVEAVNGTATATAQAIDAAITALDLAYGAPSGAVDIRVANAQDGTTINGTITAPLIHETTLDDGLRFASQVTDDGWTTAVAALPATSDGSLLIGDHLVALMGAAEPSTDSLALARSLATLLDEGAPLLQFAVRRDDSVWVGRVALSDDGA